MKWLELTEKLKPITRYEKELLNHIFEPIPYFMERSFETEFWLRENGLK